MSKEMYCEPCRRLLRGELSLHFDNGIDLVRFDHHLDYGSFERAMQLPCLICTLAWAGQENLPNETGWKELEGIYVYHPKDERLLFFCAQYNGHSTYSSQLCLEDISSR